MPLSQGQVLNNRYRIVKLLGQGGFGAVYRAWDTNLNRPCALKENLETTPGAQHQFQTEATLLSGLSHPNLPRVTDHFFVPEQGQYLVMDFVEGTDLQDILDKQGGALPESQVIPWVEQVCDALGYLHTQNPPIIHRDIKPKNIIISPAGKAMLVDFGIAKMFDPNRKTTLGARAVTPGYSPQEQYGVGRTDSRTDIYAIGATLYTLLTGREPVESVQRNSTPLIAPRQVNPAISPAIDVVIQRALAMNPDQRFQTASEFKLALSSPAAIPSTPVVQLTQKVRSSSSMIGAAAMGMVLCGLLVLAGIIVGPKLFQSTPTAIVKVIANTPMPEFTETNPPVKKGETTPGELTPTQPLTSMNQQVTNTSTPTAQGVMPPTPTDTPQPVKPTFDPASGRIVMSSTRGGDNDLWIMNANGSKLNQLTFTINWDECPEFSPNGKWVAWAEKHDTKNDWKVHIIRVDRSDAPSELADGANPSWSPDMQWIAFNHTDKRSHSQIYRISPSGESIDQLTSDSWDSEAPAWSPDGKRIVMMSKIEKYWQLVILDVNSRTKIPLTEGSPDKRFPEWSPDGKWIAYNTRKIGSVAPDQIWIIPSDGIGVPLQVTKEGMNGRPAWSHDSQYLVFQSSMGTQSVIVRINIDRSGYQVISPDIGDSTGDQMPDWIFP